MTSPYLLFLRSLSEREGMGSETRDGVTVYTLLYIFPLEQAIKNWGSG